MFFPCWGLDHKVLQLSLLTHFLPPSYSHSLPPPLPHPPLAPLPPSPLLRLVETASAGGMEQTYCRISSRLGHLPVSGYSLGYNPCHTGQFQPQRITALPVGSY